MPKERSEVWRKFTKLNPKEARCKDCGIVLKACGNTTNLWAHLHAKHDAGPRYIDETDPDEPMAIVEASPPTSQLKKQAATKKHFTTNSQQRVNTLHDVLSRADSFSEKGPGTARNNEMLLYMISKDNMPFRTVEKEGFVQFVKQLCPRYQLPSRKTLTRMLDDKFDVLRERVKEEFAQMEHCTLTSDVWTDSHNMKSYLGITVHYREASKPTEIISATVGVIPLDESHTAQYLASVIGSTCVEWNISLEKVKLMVTDSGANIVAAATLLFGKSKHIPCFAHTLNLVAEHETRKVDSPVKDLIDRVSNIVAYFKRSVKAADELRAIQLREGKSEGTLLKLIQRVRTRWNSEYAMVERFIELADIVGMVLLRYGKDAPPMLTGSEMETLTVVRRLLKPLADATVEMSAEKTTTASKIIPIVHLMKQMIDKVEPPEEDEVANKLKASLLTEMEKRFKHVEAVQTFSHATLLDPRFKRMYFQNPKAHADAVSSVTAKVNAIRRQDPPAAATSNNAADSSAANSSDNLWSIHENLVASAPPVEADNPGNISGELRQFLHRAVLPRSEDPLRYWESAKEHFPNLHKVAVDYLSRVVTSVPAERLFSKTGDITTQERNRLNPKRLGKLVFLSSVSRDLWLSQPRK